MPWNASGESGRTFSLKGGTGLVDRNVVLRKLSELETYRLQVNEFSNITLQKYKADWKTQRIVERTLQMMIETCVDIAGHIISDSAMRPPNTYADTFRVLFENHIIGPELFAILEKMAKFRNVIVHQYEEVDAEIVIVVLEKHLGDFEDFKKKVLSYIKASETAGS
jgi:uncharacterized protein YutE (UPF0331/DUF86 family)